MESAGLRCMEPRGTCNSRCRVDSNHSRVPESSRDCRPSVFKMVVAVFLLMTFFPAGVIDAGEYKVRRRSGAFTVDITINRNPPVLGSNIIRIRIRDGRDRYVRGAQVLVNYSMPPMPGMPPMNYTTPAKGSGDEYEATMNLIMTGPWNIIIMVRERGKSWYVIFPIDVR